MPGLTRSLPALGGAALALALCGSAHADEQIVRDAQGRVIQRIREEGLAIWYRYDASGRLLDERRSDGRVVRHEAEAPRRAADAPAR